MYHFSVTAEDKSEENADGKEKTNQASSSLQQLDPSIDSESVTLSMEVAGMESLPKMNTSNFFSPSSIYI